MFSRDICQILLCREMVSRNPNVTGIVPCCFSMLQCFYRSIILCWAHGFLGMVQRTVPVGRFQAQEISSKLDVIAWPWVCFTHVYILLEIWLYCILLYNSHFPRSFWSKSGTGDHHFSSLHPTDAETQRDRDNRDVLGSKLPLFPCGRACSSTQ